MAIPGFERMGAGAQRRAGVGAAEAAGPGAPVGSTGDGCRGRVVAQLVAYAASLDRGLVLFDIGDELAPASTQEMPKKDLHDGVVLSPTQIEAQVRPE